MVVFVCILLSVLGFIALFAMVTWIWFVPLIMRVFAEPPWLQASIFRSVEGAEDCEFQTEDGLTLRGSYLPAFEAPRRGVIVFCHEFAGNRWGVVPYAEGLRQQGFDLFTFDFRNHGTSDRLSSYQPLPWLTQYELADIRAAINYVTSRSDADPNGVGLIGVSKGANAALCAAAMDGRVRAIVTDGAFPLGPMQRHYIRRFMNIYVALPLAEKLPDVFFVSYCQLAKFLLGLRRRCRFINVEQMARRVHCPVFMIHAMRDGYIPFEVVHDLRRRLAGRSKMWIVPGVKHNGAIIMAADEYRRRILRFFQKHLAGGRDFAWQEQTNGQALVGLQSPRNRRHMHRRHADAVGSISPALESPAGEPI